MKQFAPNSSYLPKIAAKNSKHSALFERNEPVEGWGLRSRQNADLFHTKLEGTRWKKSQMSGMSLRRTNRQFQDISQHTHTVQMGLHTQTDTQGWRGHVHKLQYMLERSEREILIASDWIQIADVQTRCWFCRLLTDAITAALRWASSCPKAAGITLPQPQEGKKVGGDGKMDGQLVVIYLGSPPDFGHLIWINHGTTSA